MARKGKGKGKLTGQSIGQSMGHSKGHSKGQSLIDTEYSVCPMLNTLVREGDLNFSFTKEEVAAVMKERLNVHPDVTNLLFTRAFVKGLNDTATTMSLASINKPGLSEHDVSLFRNDFALSSSFDDYVNVNENLVDMFNDSISGSTFDRVDLANFRNLRYSDSLRRNPILKFTREAAVVAAGNAALLMLTLGKDNAVRKTLLKNFMLKESLDGFTRPEVEISMQVAMIELGKNLELINPLINV